MWWSARGVLSAVFIVLPAGVALLLDTAWVRELQLGLAEIVEQKLNRKVGAVLTAIAGISSIIWLIKSGFGAGFLDVLANDILYLRVASYEVPKIVSFVNTGLMLALLAMYGLALFSPMLGQQQNEPVCLLFALCVVCWPIPFALTGVENTSIRYFLVPIFMMLWTVSLFLETTAVKILQRVGIGFLLLGAFANTVVWAPILSKESPMPKTFIVGNFEETSAHFLPMDDLVNQARQHRACNFKGDFFLVMPLRFLSESQGWSCDPAVVFRPER